MTMRAGSRSLWKRRAARALPRRTASSSPEQFRVLQYNVLAKKYASNKEPWFLYGGLQPGGDAERASAIAARHVARGADGRYENVGWPSYVTGILSAEEIAAVEERDAVFDFERRGPRLIETIQSVDADLLSLVEVDEYATFWDGALRDVGLASVWHRRPRERSPDGCLVAYKEATWALEASRGFSYVEQSAPEDRGALIALLRRRTTGERVVFVSTHLARMKPGDRAQRGLRLCQVAHLMTELADFCAAEDLGDGVPAVICGDWNTTSLEEIRAVTRATLRLEGVAAHDILFSAMDVPTPATSITLLRRSKIDYIMFQEGLLELVDSDTTTADASGCFCIPNEAHPSDHLPIFANFAFAAPAAYRRGRAAGYVQCWNQSLV